MTLASWLAVLLMLVCIIVVADDRLRKYFLAWRLFMQRKWLQHKILLHLPPHNLASTIMNNAASGRCVTFTITTCCRLHSFIDCFEAFLKNATDRDEYIKEYIVVDDGSSASDRAAMQDAFPFCRFVFHNKGHPHSMNTILSMLETPFWLAWEDDWELQASTPLLTRAMAVLQTEPKAMQVALNGGWDDVAGAHRTIPPALGHHGPIRYHLLEYPPSQLRLLTPESVARGCCRSGDAIWPLFSLQPALNRTQYFQALGPFITDWRANSQPRYFVWELEYATRFVTGGAWKGVLGKPHATQREGTRSVSAAD